MFRLVPSSVLCTGGRTQQQEERLMKSVPPAIREQVLEAWHRENATERQLAERFNLTRVLVREIISDARSVRSLPINRQVMSIARELYNVMPTEVAASFAHRFESISGVRPGLLAVPRL
jgi:DNA-binding transcriptional regulator LsrR (DeoR family)